MDIKKSLTEKGCKLMQFKDLYGKECSIQESSLATEYAIWVGVTEERMHLTQEQVKELLPILQKFADTGEIWGGKYIGDSMSRIKVHEMDLRGRNGHRDKDLETEIDKFITDNNIPKEKIINITFKQPNVACLIYAESK